MKTIVWWAISILMLVFGLLGFVAVTVNYFRIPAESELTIVEGEPKDVETPEGGKVEFVVRFTVDGYRIEHPKQHGSYARVAHRAKLSKSVRVGIASLTGGTPKRGEIATLYTMTAGNETVLSYEEIMSEQWVVLRGGVSERDRAPLPWSGVHFPLLPSYTAAAPDCRL